MQRLEHERPARLSRAALETLAVVAYRQPVTRAEIEHVRGVDCGPVLRSLLERHLVRIAGHREVPGRPMLYGTTRRFLEIFGLASLEDLPTLRDVEELARAAAAAAAEAGVDARRAGGRAGGARPRSTAEDDDAGASRGSSTEVARVRRRAAARARRASRSCSPAAGSPRGAAPRRCCAPGACG